MKIFLSLTLTLLSLSVISEAHAHEGPPFPILVDQKFLDHKLSVWADPDTGNGLFLFYPEGEKLNPNDYLYEVITSTKNGEQKELLAGISMRSVDEKGKFTFTVSVPFTREAIWNIQILVKNKQNGDIVLDQTIPVEVTPPGPNRLESLIYLIPFLLLGGIWIKVVIHKRKKTPPAE